MNINYLHILTLIFVGCKLAEVITWSWWLVLLPSIISMTIGALILVVALAFAVWVSKD